MHNIKDGGKCGIKYHPRFAYRRIIMAFYFIFGIKCDTSKVDNFQNNHPFLFLLLLFSKSD